MEMRLKQKSGIYRTLWMVNVGENLTEPDMCEKT